MRKVIIILLIASAVFACSRTVQKTDTIMQDNKITIWSTIHRNLRDEKGQRSETDETVIGDTDLIKKCPIAVRTIIAFYSDIINENVVLAEALGNFSSLAEARQVLLKDKEQSFENVPKIDGRDRPGLLEIEYSKSSVIVRVLGIWGRHIGTYEYRINKKGEIKYLETN